MKWEYLVVVLSRIIDDFFQEKAVMDNSEILCTVGRDGWELVSVDNGIAYFKRPIQEPTKNYKMVELTEDARASLEAM